MDKKVMYQIDMIEEHIQECSILRTMLYYYRKYKQINYSDIKFNISREDFETGKNLIELYIKLKTVVSKVV